MRSPYGKIALPATLTEDIVPGAVAIPHSRAPHGGWQVAFANASGGGQCGADDLDDPDDVEPLSGMAWLSRVPIEVERT